jgi:hypothetical protein
MEVYIQGKKELGCGVNQNLSPGNYRIKYHYRELYYLAKKYIINFKIPFFKQKYIFVA